VSQSASARDGGVDVEEVPGTNGLGHGPKAGGECRVQQSEAACACDSACLLRHLGSYELLPALPDLACKRLRSFAHLCMCRAFLIRHFDYHLLYPRRLTSALAIHAQMAHIRMCA